MVKWAAGEILLSALFRPPFPIAQRESFPFTALSSSQTQQTNPPTANTQNSYGSCISHTPPTL